MLIADSVLLSDVVVVPIVVVLGLVKFNVAESWLFIVDMVAVSVHELPL